MEKVRSWCGQPSDQGRLKNRTEQVVIVLGLGSGLGLGFAYCLIILIILQRLFLCGLTHLN